MEKLTSSTLVKQNLFGYLQSLTGFVANFFLAVILPITMGAYFFGIFSLAMSFAYLVVGLFCAGFDFPTMRFISSFWATRKFDKLKATFLYLLRLKFAVAAVASLALFFLSDFIALFYSIPNFSFLLKIVSPLIFFYAVLTSITSAFIGIRRSEKSLAIVTLNGLMLILLPILLFLANGVEGAILGAVLSFILPSFAVLFLWTKLKKLGGKKESKIDKPEIRSNVLQFSLVSLFNLFLFMGIVVILGAFVAPSEVAYFKISLSWFAAAGILIPISSQIFFSSIIGLKTADKSKAGSYLYKAMKYSSALVIPLMFGAYFLGTDLINLVYGESFYLAGLSLEVIAWSLLFNFMASLFYGVMTAYNKVREMASTYLICTIISLIFSLVAISYFGLFGASVSFFFANTLLFLVLLLPIQRMTGINIGRFMTKPLIASVIMAVFITIVRPLAIGILGRVVLIILSMLLYFSVLFAIKGVGKEDLKLVRALR